jgi:hypothetical protein
MKPLVLTNRKPLYARLVALSVIVVSGLLTMTTNGCNQGAEGDRCNPGLVSTSPMYNEDECGSGLSCQQPPFCPENYCCPKDANTPVTSDFCKPGCSGGAVAGCAAGNAAACAFLDGGTE